MNTETTPQTIGRIRVAAVYAPGRAIFGTDLLDLTVRAWEEGINLTGEWIRGAEETGEGGVWVEGGSESKHYRLDGVMEN